MWMDMLRNAWLDVLALEGEITKSPCLTRNVSSCQWGCLQPNNPYSRSTNFLLFLTALATDTASYIFPKSLFSSLFFLDSQVPIKRNTDFWSQRSVFKFWIWHLQALWYWRRYIMYLSSSFLIWKMVLGKENK